MLVGSKDVELQLVLGLGGGGGEMWAFLEAEVKGEGSTPRGGGEESSQVRSSLRRGGLEAQEESELASRNHFGQRT
jgi:RNA 3'-terminal phosphate cyclase